MAVAHTPRLQAILAEIRPAEVAACVVPAVDGALVALQGLQDAAAAPAPDAFVIAVRACSGLLAQLFGAFPPPSRSTALSDDGFELAFVGIEQKGGRGLMPPLAPHSDAATQAALAARVYGQILKDRLLLFGTQLEASLGDPVPPARLLAAHAGALGRAVQGVLFGILAPFAPATRRADVWPGYRSGTHDQRVLREALVRLQDLDGAWSDDATDASGLRHIIADVAQVGHSSADLAAVLARYEEAGRPVVHGDVARWIQLVAAALNGLTQADTPSY